MDRRSRLKARSSSSITRKHQMMANQTTIMTHSSELMPSPLVEKPSSSSAALVLRVPEVKQSERLRMILKIQSSKSN